MIEAVVSAKDFDVKERRIVVDHLLVYSGFAIIGSACGFIIGGIAGNISMYPIRLLYPISR